MSDAALADTAEASDAALASARALSDAALASARAFAFANLFASFEAFSVASAACDAARSDFNPVMIPARSETVNLAIADLTGAANPVTAVTPESPVTTTVTSPATAVESDAVAVPRTAPVDVLVAVAVVNVVETAPPVNVEPIKVTVAVSDTALPKTSVVLIEIVGIVPTAVADGTEIPKLYADPARPAT